MNKKVKNNCVNPPKKQTKITFSRPSSSCLNMLVEKGKKVASAAADKRRSVFAPLISGNYICWHGGKWSSPREVGWWGIVRISLCVIRLKLQGKEKISCNNRGAS